MQFLCETKWLKMLVLLVVPFLFNSCFATSKTQGPPPMTKHAGVAPKTAMLPIINTNDKAVADYVSQNLVNCLKERNVFTFVPQKKVDQAVKKSGFDLDKILGLSNAEYKALANMLGVDYVIYGVVTIKKDLTFTGWRKDVDVYIRVHDSVGKKVDTWRSMTDFTWAKNSTALDAEQMAESAANHTCAKMLTRSY